VTQSDTEKRGKDFHPVPQQALIYCWSNESALKTRFQDFRIRIHPEQKQTRLPVARNHKKAEEEKKNVATTKAVWAPLYFF
jgi:hypothetical protein